MDQANTGGTRFTIRKKLLLGFTGLFIVLLITILISVVQVNNARNYSISFQNSVQPAFQALEGINSDTETASAALRGWMLTGSDTFKKEFESSWQEVASSKDILNQLKNTVFENNEALLTQWQNMQTILTELKIEQDKIIQSTHNEQNKAAMLEQFMKEVVPRRGKLRKAMGNMQEKAQGGLIVTLQAIIEKDMTAMSASLWSLLMIEWVLLIAGIIISIFISWITSRSIVNPIQAAIDVARNIARGERRIQISITGNDETADLLKALSDMHAGIVESEQKLQSSEAKVQTLLSDLQERIKKYRDYVSDVSSGDLTKSLTITGEDDLANLGTHLNAMTQSLSKIARQISEATNDISTGLKQLESATASQAVSASQQATSVTEVTSVVEEIKAISRQTSDKAAALGISAEKTHQEGEKGQESVDKMIASMQSLKEKIQQIADTILGLSDKTQKIDEITDVVSDIAKQSKMLALNASIEAARAGESGKGFAVVAVEVKALAEKSQASTERVKQILQDIRETAERAVMVSEAGIKSVEQSSEQTQQTGKIVNALASVTQESAMASQQIVAAVREESVGIDQMVLSIAEIDKVTSQFSSSTEQTKQAAVNLGNVAAKLKQSVSVYKLSKE
jgi:methyl-accepting chemotaxis protein